LTYTIRPAIFTPPDDKMALTGTGGFEMRNLSLALAAVFALIPGLSFAAPAQARWPGQASATVTMRDVRFADGSSLPEMKAFYVTLGTPHRNAAGRIDNAVLMLHGTSGTSGDFLRPQTADALFAPGAPLDAAKYYIIIPDNVGRGGSSKPSDGLKSRFPHYRYKDMVDIQHRLLTEHLGVQHLRAIVGTSMGGMHTWMWAELYPDFMDAAVPINTQPTRISGRNWMMRQVTIAAIRNDPDWKGGEYDKQPTLWTRTSPALALMTDGAAHLLELAPDVESGNALVEQWTKAAQATDANDVLWGREAVVDYNPEPLLGRIKTRLLAINFEDDAVNPYELRVMEPVIAKLPNAKFVLLPTSPATRGHLSYTLSALWAKPLGDFLKTLPAPR
jgi:homoserine O-acetyltransferase